MLDWLPTYPTLPQQVRRAAAATPHAFVYVRRIPDTDWLPTYPTLLPPQKRRLTATTEHVFVHVRTPVAITQYVVEAWITPDETQFDNAVETVALTWVEITFRSANPSADVPVVTTWLPTYPNAVASTSHARSVARRGFYAYVRI